jgi:Phasin protein
MQYDYSKQWAEIIRSVNKPMVALTELNVKAFNKFIKKQEHLENFMHAKKPEDVISAQLELLKSVSSEAIEYGQEAFNIWTDAISDFTHQFNRWTSESVKSGLSPAKPSKG